MRLIDAAEVIKAVDKHTFETKDGLCLDDDISIILEDVPTIEERKWIPCSKRLPDTTDFVLTINIVSQCGVYRFDGDCWLDYDGLFVNEGIRAWMPLPEPI